MADRAGARKRRRGRLFRRGATWYGRLREAGGERTRSLHTGDRAEAARRLAAWAEAQSGARFTGPRRTWEDAVAKWEDEIARGLKPATAERYRTSLWQLDATLSGKLTSTIDRAELGRAVAARREAGATNATINRDLTAISSVLGAAAAWGWIDEDPTRRFDRRRLTRERRDPIRIPAQGDVDLVLTRAPGAFRDMLAFLAETGMRQEEAAGLEWNQLSPDLTTVTLTRTKTGRPRTLELRDAASAVLRVRARHLGSPVVFWHGPNGKRYTTVPGRFRVIMAKVMAKHPIARFRCHDLRHKFAVDRLCEGWDIYDLARYMGHSTVKTTEIYLGYVPGGAPIARGTNRGTSARKRPAAKRKSKVRASG